MLANPALFPLPGPTSVERAAQAWDEAKEVKKSEFALKHALSTDSWSIPRYIREGLVWLADLDGPPPAAIATIDKVVL